MGEVLFTLECCSLYYWLNISDTIPQEHAKNSSGFEEEIRSGFDARTFQVQKSLACHTGFGDSEAGMNGRNLKLQFRITCSIQFVPWNPRLSRFMWFSPTSHGDIAFWVYGKGVIREARFMLYINLFLFIFQSWNEQSSQWWRIPNRKTNGRERGKVGNRSLQLGGVSRKVPWRHSSHLEKLQCKWICNYGCRRLVFHVRIFILG